MSNHQPRADIRDSFQYRKTARPSSSNQHRGGKSGGGGVASAAPPNPSLSSSRSFNRKHSNAPAGQLRASGVNVTSEGNAPSAARAVQNGAHQKHSLGGGAAIAGAPSSITTPSKPTDETPQKMVRSVPTAPSSSVDSTGPVSNAPSTPAKAHGDVSRSFPLQFGSISPGFMNGMQVPARTSSAPPNLDEQKRDQVHHESPRVPVPAALPTPPSISKQPLPRKNTAVDKTSSGEAQPAVARSKRDATVTVPPPLTQSQKAPSATAHPMPGMHMQIPFHPRPHAVQFGPPQIQSQAMSASSFPIQVQVPLLGNPPLQQTVFVPGFPPHPIQSQGIIHQGQGLSFPSGMSPQLGMAIPPQFSQQQAGKFGGTRIPVKITHPETHEELRLDGSSGTRSHHNNIPPQSQSLSSFPPSQHSSYSSYVSYQHPNPLPPNNAQGSQPTRVYNQVTVKPASGAYGEKEQLPSVSSPTGKDSQKHSKLHGATSGHPQRDSQISSHSSLTVSKPGDGSVSTSIPAIGKQSTVLLSSCLDSAPSSSSSASAVLVESSTSVAPIVTAEDASEVWKKKPSHRGHQSMQDQNAKESSNLSVIPSQSPSTKEVDMPDLGTNFSVDTTEESPPLYDSTLDAINAKSKGSPIKSSSNPSSTMSLEGDPLMTESSSKNNIELKMQKSLEQDSNPCESSLESVSLESSEIANRIGEDFLSKVTNSIEYDTSTQTTAGMVDDSAIGSLEGHSEDHSLSSSVLMSDNVKSDDTPSQIDVSARDGHVGSKEIAVTTSSFKNQESESRSFQSHSMTASKGEDGHAENNNTGSFAKEKSVTEQNVQKSTTTRVKKKKKELFKKADAAGASSDLYMAYKGPEEKKEIATYVESMDSATNDNSNLVITQVTQDSLGKKDTMVKVEPDDWEDAADVSSPNMESAGIGEQVVDGFRNYGEDSNATGTKKYSRDFLLKFADQHNDLPEGFEITSDIAETVMAVNANFSRDSYPSPGRVIDRPSSVSRPDRRGNGMIEEEKWNKLRGSGASVRDMRLDLAYGGNPMGFQPGQGSNYGVLRNPRAPSPTHYAGGILTGPMQSMAAPGAGIPRNSVDSDRWQRGSVFQKGLMPSPQAPSQLMHKAEKKYEVGKVTDEEEAKQRQLKAILNKLTPQNFEKLFQQVKEVNIDNVTTLTGVISQIFDKALMEPTFCEMYANFCQQLASELPDLSVDNEKITFKRLLLNKCQEEFERGEREEQEANNTTDGDGETKLSDEEREERRLKARRRMLGNIRLIGELYKKKMLTERIMHSCITKLLGEYQSPDEENIESLCKLMSTIGEMIDHPKAKEHIDFYFDAMSNLSNNMKLSSRVRFMLKDAIDLRKNKWQQRRKVEGPKKIEEVHRDAAQERHAQASRMSRAPSMGSSVRRGPPMDFTSSRGGSSMLPSQSLAQMGGGFRPVSSQMRGFGGQDVRMEDRHHSFDNRTFSVPLPQRSVGDEITLGPQGGLGRGMSFRGHGGTPSVSSTTDVHMNPGDSRRIASGPNGYSSVLDRTTTYGQREDMAPKYMPERFSSQHDHPGTQEKNMPHVGSRGSNFDTVTTPTSPLLRGGGTSFTQSVPPDGTLPGEEHLRGKSISAIREFYSARDENEVALCVKELDAPSFYPSMISIWITDSFERKDNERDLFGELIVDLIKSQDVILSQDQLIKGFEYALESLEDAVNDAPKAAEFLGRLFAKVILENVIPLKEIGHLIYVGGYQEGRLREIGLAAEVLGSALEVIKTEKGEAILSDLCRSSNLHLHSFRPPASNKQWKLDKFL